MKKHLVCCLVCCVSLLVTATAASPAVTALCRFVDPDTGNAMLGAVLENEQILPLQAAYAALNSGQTSRHLESVDAFFAGDGLQGKAVARTVVQNARDSGVPMLTPDEVTLLTPVTPVKLIAGSIFEGHATRSREAWARELYPFQWALAKMIGGFPFKPPPAHYENVTYYQGNHLGWYPHKAAVPLPETWDGIDFEVEIAMLVVGDPEEGFKIGGYFLFNDLTHRRTQGLEIDKVKHGFSASKHVNAAGWKLVLAEYVDFSKITVDAALVRANGDVQRLCSGDTDDALFSPQKVLDSIAGRDGGLYHGQVITTGTLTGCCGLEIMGAANADLLQPGDTIRFHSDVLGTLENKIVAD